MYTLEFGAHITQHIHTSTCLFCVNTQQKDVETDRHGSARKKERASERTSERQRGTREKDRGRMLRCLAVFDTVVVCFCHIVCCCFCIYMDVKLFDAGMSPRRFILQFTSPTSIFDFDEYINHQNGLICCIFLSWISCMQCT